MGDTRLVPPEELRPGDKLGQDIMVGNQVLLRSGTELNDVHVRRIRRLALRQVCICNAGTPVLLDEPALEAVAFPSFRDLASEDQLSWMADEHFSRAVASPARMTEGERYFALHKQALREAAGLKPLVDPEQDHRIRKEIHGAFISSVLKKVVNLDQLAAAASSLVEALSANPEGFLAFDDIHLYGQYLAAATVMSSKVFHQIRPETVNGDVSEHIRCQFALANAYAMFPFGILGSDSLQENKEQRQRFCEALLRYSSWLNSQHFVTERTLELVLLQHERYDGLGVPYGLSSEQVPPASEAWSMAMAYSTRLFSQPKRPRATGRDAADQLIGQSGRAFSARGINRLLTALGYYPTGSLVEMNSGEAALVLRQNERALLKPVVQLIDATGEPGEVIDLQHKPDQFIRRQALEY